MAYKKGNIPWDKGLLRPEMSQRLKGNAYGMGNIGKPFTEEHKR